MAGVSGLRSKLLDYALALPGAWLDHPWEEDVAKVGKKVFAFFGRPGGDVFVGVKLPRSLLFARTRPFVTRFGYGLDDAGWVAARITRGDDVPLDLLYEWIEESYEAVAPRRALGRGRKGDASAALVPTRAARSTRRAKPAGARSKQRKRP